MSWTLRTDDLGAYARGVSLLAGGGGGPTGGCARTRAEQYDLPVEVWDVHEVDPALPCIAVGFGGTTTIQAERLPDENPFGPAIDAVERWTGHPVGAVCPIEIGGTNGYAPLYLGRGRHLLDADLMGRALPFLDQISLTVQGPPELVLAVPTGDSGVVLHSRPRPRDAERVLRSAFLAAGGCAGLVVGGFTVGDLRTHAIVGSIGHALRLGRAWQTAETLPERVDAVGGELVARGRVEDLNREGGQLQHFAVVDRGGEVVRVVARSEFLCALVDGRTVAAGPTIIDVVDLATGHLLQCEEVTAGRAVGVVSLPGPAWWDATPRRRRLVGLGRHGLGELAPRGEPTDDEVCDG